MVLQLHHSWVQRHASSRFEAGGPCFPLWMEVHMGIAVHILTQILRRCKLFESMRLNHSTALSLGFCPNTSLQISFIWVELSQ